MKGCNLQKVTYRYYNDSGDIRELISLIFCDSSNGRHLASHSYDGHRQYKTWLRGNLNRWCYSMKELVIEESTIDYSECLPFLRVIPSPTCWTVISIQQINEHTKKSTAVIEHTVDIKRTINYLKSFSNHKDFVVMTGSRSTVYDLTEESMVIMALTY